jgi:hypothetical protein
VPDPRAYRTLEFMRTTFLNSLSDLARDDQRRMIRALELLDVDEPVLSLRVHHLKGSRAGLWSASASRNLRITFYAWRVGANCSWNAATITAIRRPFPVTETLVVGAHIVARHGASPQ